jgi:hypothetical protein
MESDVVMMFEIADCAAGGPDGVLYGWGPWHTFLRLLAAEENVDLAVMVDFGGSRPWDSTPTVLRPLFDLDRLRTATGAMLAPVATRLRQIHARWAAGQFADDPGQSWMRELQVETLGKLAALIDHCAHTGARITVR